MSAGPESADFWSSDELWVAVNPYRPSDADGLAEFALVNETTRSLLYFQTSGSEGKPKWVGLTRAAFLASAHAVNAHLESTARDRWLIALPLYHVGGFSIFARCFASGAASVRFGGQWNPQLFNEVCETNKITLTSLVPTQVFDLVQAKQPAPNSLRAVVVGGGALSRETGVQARELGWPLLQSYGMTETASQIATESLEHLKGTPNNSVARASRPWLNTAQGRDALATTRGFDPERLDVLPIWNLRTDDEERLTVRGEALASGYAVRRGDGWQWEPIDRATGLRTRDHVRLWEDGKRRYLSFLGRDSEMVKVLGELVNISELQKRMEALLVTFGSAPDEAVIWPVSDTRKGTKLILVGGLPPERLSELRSHFNAAVQGFERLSECRNIVRIPRTALGKLDRAALDSMLTAQ